MISNSRSPKPKTIYFSRGTIVSGPLVSDDSDYAAVKDGMTARWDRRTLQEVWWIDSDDWWLGKLIDNSLVSVGGPRGAAVRSADDGRVLWSAPSRFTGAGVWKGQLVLDSQEGIELRDARRARRFERMWSKAGTAVGPASSTTSRFSSQVVF